MHVCICLHMYTYTNVCMHEDPCMSFVSMMYVYSVFACMYATLHGCVHVCLHVCLRVCLHVCLHVYLHVCVHV